MAKALANNGFAQALVLGALVLSTGCRDEVLNGGALDEGGAESPDAGGAAPSEPAPTVDAGSDFEPGDGIVQALGDGRPRPCAIEGLSEYTLVFDSDSDRLERRVYSMRADGSDLQPLTPEDELAQEPAVSPDGRTLAYSTPENIKLLDLASGDAESIGIAGSRYPVWSPDGVFLAIGGNTATLLLAATRSSQVDYFPEAASGSISFSEDGKEFITTNGGTVTRIDIAGYRDVEVRNAVIVGGTRALNPSPSPDGQWLVVAQECSATTPELSLWVTPYLFATPACESRRLSPRDGVSAANPEWGPGSLIAFEYGDIPRDIAIVDANTGQQCYIPRVGDDRNPSWVRVPLPTPEPPR